METRVSTNFFGLLGYKLLLRLRSHNSTAEEQKLLEDLESIDDQRSIQVFPNLSMYANRYTKSASMIFLFRSLPL